MESDKVLKVSFLTNVFLSILKVVFGIIGKSSALISDGIHSFSDLVTDVVAIFGDGISLKPADSKHPYGHGKSQYITSFIIGIIVLSLGLTLIKNVSNSEIVIPSLIVVIISVITIVLKYIVSSYLIRKGNEYKNVILISSGKESRADVISSVVVLISSILMQFSSELSYLKYSDKIASIIVGIFIVKTGFDILKESISMILGEVEQDETVINEFRKIIMENKEIKNIDELIVLKYGPYYKITSEVSMNPNITLFEAHSIVDEIESIIKLTNPKALYITIHINPYEI